MNSKRLDFEIREVFLQQLQAYESTLFKNTYCSREWNGINKLNKKKKIQIRMRMGRRY